ncbi:hypothetical protein FF38_04304, partial [Lucilia cuprina]
MNITSDSDVGIDVIDKIINSPIVDLDIINIYRKTPLAMANDQQDGKIIMKLLDAGANPWFINGKHLHPDILSARSPDCCYVYTPNNEERDIKEISYDGEVQYNNTLGFFVGNEIVNDERSASTSPPYIKAVTRDIKNYQKSQGLRKVPIGYSAADDLMF